MKKYSKIEELVVQLALELNVQDKCFPLPDVMEIQIGRVKGAIVYGELYFYSSDIDGNFELVKSKECFEKLDGMFENSRYITYYVVPRSRYQLYDLY